ncbi:MAG: aldose 1-epimerase family protein [Acidobacteriota bacterium]|nr:aldose 1-epimerase family protein [Acidobacteriota bacterium]
MAAPSPGVLPPSGEQHVIEHGRARAVITEVGATLRAYSVDGRAVVDGFAEPDICRDGRGQVLCPWPNRLGDGRYEFAGRRAQAALDEPARRNAIHGLVRYQSWALRGRAQNTVTLGCVLQPQPGYTWRLGMEVEYRLGKGGLTVRAEATNLDGVPAPLGVGFHPYLTVGTPDLDTARLHLRAERQLRTDDRGLPVGEEPVAGSEVDFSVPRPIGPTRLDTAFGGIGRDADGLARVELSHPDEDRRVTLWMDSAFRYLMLYSADRVGDGDRRRRALAVEPMTCPPDALRSGTDLVTLGPGGGWRGTWGISPS